MQFAWLLFTFCCLGDGIYVLASLATSWVPVTVAWLDFAHQCAVGLSGVLFALVVVDSNVNSSGDRRRYGVHA